MAIYLIYDRNGKKIDQLQSITSVQWRPRYYESGIAEIHVRQTPENRENLQEWFRIVRQDRREIMFIEYLYKSDNPREDIVIKGHLDNLGGIVNLYTTVIQNIEAGLLGLVQRNKRKREINVAPLKGLTPEFDPGVETTYGDLREMFTEMCQVAGLGWRQTISGATLNYLEIYQGQIQERARFSDDIGNVIAQQYENDLLNYRNIAYVYGEGDGDERTHVTVIKKRNRNEPDLEMYVDARDLQSAKTDDEGNETTIPAAKYMEQLVRRGEDKLAETAQGAFLYSCELDPSSQISKLGEDYDLGDIVPILSRAFKVYTYARVIGINFIEENNRAPQIRLELSLEYQEELN